MAKKISEIQRLVTFAMAADESTLSTAIESLIAIRASRFPGNARKPRKSKSNKQEELPGTGGA
jgi:hypothetical protein